MPQNNEPKRDPRVCPMSGKAHSPGIVHRTGKGPSADELNICGICGISLTRVRQQWIAITDEQEEAIRAAD